MTAEDIEHRIKTANVPLDPVFVRTLSKADDTTAESMLNYYINHTDFRNFVIRLDSVYSSSKEDFNLIANKIENVAKA